MLYQTLRLGGCVIKLEPVQFHSTGCTHDLGFSVQGIFIGLPSHRGLRGRHSWVRRNNLGPKAKQQPGIPPFTGGLPTVRAMATNHGCNKQELFR